MCHDGMTDYIAEQVEIMDSKVDEIKKEIHELNTRISVMESRIESIFTNLDHVIRHILDERNKNSATRNDNGK